MTPDKPIHEWTEEEMEAATPSEVYSASEEAQQDEGLEDFQTIKDEDE